MKKRLRLIKRLVALLIVLTFSIESFAAVVGDNDGAAFITKAEFDSLKSTFQAQIDRYNSSIDNKIDGAIASFLAGVKMETNKIINCPVSNFKEIYWCPDFELYSKKKTWTSRTAKSITGPNIVTPNYQNFEGWIYFSKDRGVRSTYFQQNNSGFATFSFRLDFSTDGNIVKTSTNTPYLGTYKYVVPLLCLCVDSDGAVSPELPLFQMTNLNYNLFRFGIDGQDMWGLLGGKLTITPVTPRTSNAYFALQAK